MTSLDITSIQAVFSTKRRAKYVLRERDETVALEDTSEFFMDRGKNSKVTNFASMLIRKYSPLKSFGSEYQ